MHHQGKKEQEAERLRDDQFNKYMPIIPQGRVWRVKTADHSAGLVKPLQATSLTSTVDRCDRPEQSVGPVEPLVQQKAESEVPVLAPCNEETPLAPLVQDDEELVDYEATPKRNNM